MNLSTLTNPAGAKKVGKRKGRGVGSGNGKTAGRGHKGMKARSGGSVRAGFEGGQMPLYRILPHRGFNNKNFRVEYAVVNVDTIEELGLNEVSRDELVKARKVRAADRLVKVLGHGKITKAVVVKADKFSASAVKKIEAAGGKAIVNS